MRLGFEHLECRELMAADLGLRVSSALMLASAALQQADDTPAEVAVPEEVVQPLAAGIFGGGIVNQPPSGADKTLVTLENTPYTFAAADFGFSDQDTYSLPTNLPDNGGPTAENVLVLYNSASTAGQQIANYYAQVHAGVHLLGINGVDPNSEFVTADQYLAVVRPQVLAALTSSIDVIVTTKGLPLRIQVTETPLLLNSTYVDGLGITRTVFGWQPFSSLESELARIDSISTWQSMGDQGLLLANQLARNPYYLSNSAFDYSVFGTRLTARLDGYTVADVTNAIDRAQQALLGSHDDPTGPFYFLVDNDPSKSYGVLMDNLVNQVLVPEGLPVVYDNTSAFVGAASKPIVGYVSHGVHQASAPANYLATGLTAALADGAIFHSWESFNAYSFNTSNPHGNQGQVAQWLSLGGTAGVGTVEEPTASTSTVTNEDQLFKSLIAGRTFAEAAWSANRQLSFVNTVVGDPLMRWQTLIAGGNQFAAVKIASLPAAGMLTLGGVNVSAGQFITVADINAGLLKFTPSADANGANYAHFTFQVQDTGQTVNGGGNLDLSPNTITVNVTPVDDPPTAAPPPAGFWRFDNGSTVTDSSGNGNQGTLTAGATIGSGSSGGGLLLTGSNQRVVVPDSPSLDIAESITISAWIAPSKTTTQTIVKKARTDSVDGYELSLSSSGKIFVRFNQDTAGNTFRVDSTSKYSAKGSTWTHVAATYDGSTIKLFVNGQLQGSKAATFAIASNNTALGIGAEDGGKNSMRGRIDDVLVADRALSAQEIAGLYQNSFPAGWVANQAPSVSAGPDRSITLSGTVVLGGSVSDDGQPTSNSPSVQWTVISGPGAVNFPNGASAATSATFGAVGTYVLRLTATDGELSAQDEVTVSVLPNGTLTNVVGRWGFEDGIGTTAADSSGNNNQGTLTAGASFGVGQSGSGLLLSSSSQRVVVPDSPSLNITGAITISAWIAPSTTATQTIVKKARADSVDGYELSLSSSGNVFVRFNQDTSGNAFRLDSTSKYPANGATWMHVAATYDGNTIRLYINGQLQASKGASFAIGSNNVALGIGAEDGGKNSMRGKIDDVLVADRAFTGQEINDLYLAP